MEKVRPWCGQPSDRGRLRNRTEHKGVLGGEKRTGRKKRGGKGKVEEVRRWEGRKGEREEES